jgi:hypothetical protein
MRTRRTTRRAQVTQAHAVVIGALLSALFRLIHRRCPATGGWPCLHPPCVSSRAHHPAHNSAHGHMQQRACMRALADVYMRNVAYAHSTSLTRSRPDTLVRTRAHAHAHSQTDGITHTDGMSYERHRERHTHAHTRTHALTHSCLHTHIHT